MIQKFHVEPFEAKGICTANMTLWQDCPPFPILTLDKDTYIVGIEIQSGINFDEEKCGHSILLGKYNSLAEGITTLLNLNHDYNSVSQGVLSYLKNIPAVLKSTKKCQVIIQNDVWIGHGATIMGGVIIHNGAVVAANAVVTKDVPPFAIVAGNPAKIIKYRFTEDQRQSLQTIAWWDWTEETIQKNRKDFTLDIDDFINKHIRKAQNEIKSIETLFQLKPEKPVLLVIPDFDEPYPLYERILKEYFKEKYNELELLIYLSEKYAHKKYEDIISAILLQNEELDCNVTLQTGGIEDERILFKSAQYFVTTRAEETIRYTGYADQFDVHVFAGVDTPIFR